MGPRPSLFGNSNLQTREVQPRFIAGHFDATPMCVKFGKLSEDVMPLARYLVKDEDTGRSRSDRVIVA